MKKSSGNTLGNETKGFTISSCLVYKVEINLRIVDTVFSEEKAWDIIGAAPFGSLHVVCGGFS